MKDFWELVPANPWERGPGLLPWPNGNAGLPDWAAVEPGPWEPYRPGLDDPASYPLTVRSSNTASAAAEGGAQGGALAGARFGAPSTADEIPDTYWTAWGQPNNGTSQGDSKAQRGFDFRSPLLVSSGDSASAAPTDFEFRMRALGATRPYRIPSRISDDLGTGDRPPMSLASARPGQTWLEQNFDQYTGDHTSGQATAQARTNLNASGAGFSPISPAQAQTLTPSPPGAQFVVLPNGSLVPDPHSTTGYLMSPVADLSHVANAGREAGATLRDQLFNPETAPFAGIYFLSSLFANLGHGGAFDYQRSGNQLVGLATGFTHLPHFRDVSNFNVGLFCQQAGLSLHETLSMAGTYARLMSSNYTQRAPYGLDPQNKQFIEAGFQAGQSGIFNQAP